MLGKEWNWAVKNNKHIPNVKHKEQVVPLSKQKPARTDKRG